MSHAFLDLPLDEIAKKVKAEKKAQRTEAAGRKGPKQGQKQKDGNQKSGSRGGQNGRGQGKSGRSGRGGSNKPQPYRRRNDRGDLNEDWTHDKFDNDGAEPKPVTVRPAKPAAPRREEGTKITIANLKYDVTQEDLQELFEQYGPVLSAKIRFEKDGRSTGNAFVIMRTRVDARKAVEELNGKAIDGEVMTLTLEPLLPAGSSVTKAAAATPAVTNDKYKDIDDIRISVKVDKK